MILDGNSKVGEGKVYKTALEMEQAGKIEKLNEELAVTQQNFANVIKEFTKAMNCLLCVPIEAFDAESKDWIMKYKEINKRL